jgi:hypothetical protein
MINYTLSIYKIELIFVDEAMPDYVKFIYGFITGEKNGISLSRNITSTVETIDVVNYIPYDDLTEQQALDIFSSSIDPDYYALLESELATNIEEIYTNQFPYTKPLPWL